MIRLRMTQTVDGSLDGRRCQTYEAGQEYELPDQGPGGLADVFLREGWAERVSAVADTGEGDSAATSGGDESSDEGNTEGGEEGDGDASADRADGLEALTFAELRERASQREGFKFRAGLSKADLVQFLRTGELGTPGDGK